MFIDINFSNLTVELEDLVDVRAVGEAAVLPHEVGERVVPVRHVALGEEGGVVEADVLAARHVAEEVVHEVKLGGHVLQVGPHQLQDEGGRHQGARVDVGVERLA